MPLFEPDPIEEEEEEVETCHTCDQPIDDGCECQVCPGCEDRVSCGVCSNCNECLDSCCECRTCQGYRCGNRVSIEDYCSSCERCRDCCECSTCGNCGDRVESVCGDCERCPDCGCSCSSDDNDYYEGVLRFHSAERNQYKTNPSKRYISLEVEVSSGESYRMHDFCSEWRDSLVEDGSLPDEGWEINMNPSQGDRFIDHVDHISRDLKSADCHVNASCGLHCHVDARDYRYFDLFKLCRLYCKLESGLFEMVAPSRRFGNDYCFHCADDYSFPNFNTFKNDLIFVLYGWRPESRKRNCALSYSSDKAHGHSHGEKRVFSERNEKYEKARYKALNLHSFFYRGTVEFRHHQGTIDATKMKNWGMICGSILDAASSMSVKMIDALPKDSFSALCSILRPELREYAIERRKTFMKEGN